MYRPPSVRRHGKPPSPLGLARWELGTCKAQPQKVRVQFLYLCAGHTHNARTGGLSWEQIFRCMRDTSPRRPVPYLASSSPSVTHRLRKRASHSEGHSHRQRWRARGAVCVPAEGDSEMPLPRQHHYLRKHWLTDALKTTKWSLLSTEESKRCF